jgi:hypothetical protein
MKYDCDIIRDLMPMYDDKIASEKSREAVEEHIKKCDSCRAYYQSLRGVVEVEQPEVSSENKEQDFQAVAKKVRKKRKVVVAAVTATMIIAIASVVWIGSHIPLGQGNGFFTSASAVESISWVEDSSNYITKESVGPFEVYVYENEESYQTVVTRYQFPYWNVGYRNTCKKFPDDSVLLLGRVSMSHNDDAITFLSVQNNDPKVSYIEIGPEGDRIRKQAPVGEVLTFSWERSYRWNDENAIAYSEDGTPIYELGYDMVGNTIKTENYHWISVSEQKHK